MNGKDLMQALNDIDERYIEEALPWSAAVKKERHPVWALAAGLALCLGLGAGAALLFGGPLLTSGDPGPEVTTLENAATGEARAAEQEAPEVPIPDLEFAVNDTGIGRATGGVYAAGEGTQRELTLDELSSLREQPGLSWMGGYYLTGTALFDENGGTLQVMVAGYDPSIVDESLETFPVTESPAFTLVLGKEGESGLPNAIEDQLFFLEEPNNTVEGVGVRAARSEEEGVYIDPVSGESRSAQVTLYCTGCTLDGASVGLMAIADGTALTEEEAQRLAEVAAGYGVHYGLSLEGLSAEPKGKDAPNVNYGDSYHLTVLGPLGSRAPLDFAAYTVETQEEYGSYEEFLQAMEEDFNLGRWPEGFAEGSTNRELTQEEMQSIWGGQLPWQENLPLAGWAVFDPSGDLEGVYLYGADEGSQEIGSRFLVVLRPGPLDWEALRRRELSYDIIQKPNNQVNGQDVYAVTTALDQFYEDDAGEGVDLGDHITYQASFQTDSLAVTVYGYAQGAAGDTPTPEEQQAEALARDKAQALVETVTGRSLYGPLSLEGIAGGADSAPQEESTSSQTESAVSSEIEENESTEGGLNYLDVSFNTSEYITYMNEQTHLYQHYAEAEQRGEPWLGSRGLEEDELNFLLNQDFLPNQEDFAILEGGATLDWMEEPLWVELSGFPTQETRSSGISAFTLYLSKGDVPVSEAKYLSTLFPEPNNTLEGVDIYAFRWEEAVSYHVFTDYTTDYPYPHPTPFHDSDQSVELGLAFQKEDIGVAMTVRCDKWGFASEEEAQDFALSLAENIITQEVIPMENDMQVLSLPEN